MEEKLVTVIIPTYKRPVGLHKAIMSVLNQKYQNIELIVIDDNNPETSEREETEKLMKEFSTNERITYIRHHKNLNGSVARNTGIECAQGEYIAFLDNDDIFRENKISLQVMELENKGQDYGVVYTKFSRMKNGKLFDKGIEKRTGNLTLEILKGNFYISAGSNLLVRKELINKINGFNPKFKRRQDLEFLIRLSRITKIAHVNEDCLIINKDDRSNEKELTKEDYEKNKQDYLNLFKTIIKNQNEVDRKKIHLSQELPRLRKEILSLNFKEIRKFKVEQKVTYFLLVRYTFYLVKRKLLKQCYGFQV